MTIGDTDYRGTQHYVDRRQEIGRILCVVRGGGCCRKAVVMARLARVEAFAADEIAIVHVMNRTVRRCFLLGDDPFSEKNFDHRKRWLDEQLRLLKC